MNIFRQALLFTALICSFESTAESKELRERVMPDPFCHLLGSARVPNSQLEALRFSDSEWNDGSRAYLAIKPHYLTDWQSHITLPPPPANTSMRTRAELDYMLELQKERTSQDIEIIKKEADFGPFYIGRWLGPEFNEKNLPITAQFLRNSADDFVFILFSIKKHYARARPHVLDPRIKPCIEVPAWPAYPSGHATDAFAFAYILSELRPDQAIRFRADALRIAMGRETAGLHFTSDTGNGIILARSIVDQFMTTPAFLSELEKVRAEWKTKGLLKAAK